jgi:prephenate dehydratase/chorismate mutase/prephenate dehydratase
MNLDHIRKKINFIDYEIIKLLNERFELFLKSNKSADQTDKKTETNDSGNHPSPAMQLISNEFSDQLFKKINTECLRLGKEDFKLCGFQGEHGSFSELAALKFTEKLVPIPCQKYIDVYEGILQNTLDFGILPISNSFEGAVTEVNDMLIEAVEPIYVVGEVKTTMNYSLMALPDTDYRDIKVVYSHPKTLSRCRSFLQRNNLESKPFYDSAGAANMLYKERPKGSAVIASPFCAELYNLQIIKENIGDDANAFTRYFILSKTRFEKEGDKCSIAFSTKHEAGALINVLQIFSKANINLSRIESRPIKNNPGESAFLVDFKGSDQNPDIRKILQQIEKTVIHYKFLGSYQQIKL